MQTPIQAQQDPLNLQQEITRSKVRTLPSGISQAPSPWISWMLGIMGLSLLGAASWIMTADPSSTAYQFRRALALEGIHMGHLLVGGLTLVGLAVVSRTVVGATHALLRPGELEESLTEVGTDIAEFRNQLQDFANDHIHFRSTLDGLQKEVHAHRQSDRSQEAVDALFRMAGSLDTLHARFDQRITESSKGVESTLGELGSLIEASRDYLQDSLEETDRRVLALTEQVHELSMIPEPEAPQAEDPCEEQPSLDEEPAGSEADQDPFHLELDEPPLGLGVLDELDDLTPADPWCDADLQQGLKRLDQQETGEGHRTPTTLEAPLGPLPACGESSSNLERMEDVLRDPTSARIVEKFDLEGPTGE